MSPFTNASKNKDMKEERDASHCCSSHPADQASLTELNTRLPALSEIKVKLPAHCFRANIRKSLYYVTLDIFYIGLAYMLITQLQQMLKYGFLLFPLYWYVQGTLYMALFSLGHDCTHASFSPYPLLNDCVGTLLFTWILIPYYPWKITHKNHHKNTGNMDKDEAFYPIRGGTDDQDWMIKLLLWIPGITWFYYLLAGCSPRNKSHFNPFESIFAQHLLGVTLSLSAYATMLYWMSIYAIKMGMMSLLVHHLIPVFIFATYFVVVTFLHHTEMHVPWFTDQTWHHVEGQLSTVDRYYGYVHSIIHSIGTHQIHHLFPKIPHYHLEEATTHFRRNFPHLVRLNNDGILSSFVRMSRKFIQQRNVQNDTHIFSYSNERNASLHS